MMQRISKCMAMLVAVTMSMVATSGAWANCNDTVVEFLFDKAPFEFVYDKTSCSHGKLRPSSSKRLVVSNVDGGMYGADCTIYVVNINTGDFSEYRIQQNYCALAAGNIKFEKIDGLTLKASIQKGSYDGPFVKSKHGRVLIKGMASEANAPNAQSSVSPAPKGSLQPFNPRVDNARKQVNVQLNGELLNSRGKQAQLMVHFFVKNGGRWMPLSANSSNRDENNNVAIPRTFTVASDRLDIGTQQMMIEFRDLNLPPNGTYELYSEAELSVENTKVANSSSSTFTITQ